MYQRTVELNPQNKGGKKVLDNCSKKPEDHTLNFSAKYQSIIPPIPASHVSQSKINLDNVEYTLYLVNQLLVNQFWMSDCPI
jgi:hypothetical protein